MKPIIDSYRNLAGQLQSPPPEVPEYRGYSGFPVLTVTRGQDTVIITPGSDMHLEHEQGILYRDPYTDLDGRQRMAGAAAVQAGQAAMGILDAFAGSSMRRRRRTRQVDSSPLTLVKLIMPPSFKGSRILIRPETLPGKMTSLGEIVINHPGFDSAFKLHGGNEAMVRQLLTPGFCDALLRFKGEFGKFLLCEDYLLWIHPTYSIEGIPPVVNGLFILAGSLPR